MLFTIGHSNHAFGHFRALLRRHGIEAVADVRSRPYSRFVPHFSKGRLDRLLAEADIGYLYLGAELGGSGCLFSTCSTSRSNAFCACG